MYKELNQEWTGGGWANEEYESHKEMREKKFMKD